MHALSATRHDALVSIDGCRFCFGAGSSCPPLLGPAPRLVDGAALQVIAGHDHCEVDADARCVTDGQGPHDDGEDCMVQVLVAGNLTIRGTEEFRVEPCASCECDYVRIDDHSRMCGRMSSGNTGVRVDSVLQWHSDDSVTHAGWTLCLVPGPTAAPADTPAVTQCQGTSPNVAQCGWLRSAHALICDPSARLLIS